jgi:hypothetical protein
VDPWESILEPLLTGNGLTTPNYVPVEAIWGALKMEASYLDNRHADRVAAILERHGFLYKDRQRIEGVPRLCWFKNKPKAGKS